MVGQLEWRDGEVWEVGGGWVSDFLRFGEYIWTELPGGRRKIESVWTGKRWILEKEERWIGGSYYLRGRRVFSLENPNLRFAVSGEAAKRPRYMQMHGGRPVYHDRNNVVRDARTDDELFYATTFRTCYAGSAILLNKTLRFTDGVRRTISLGNIGEDEEVHFLRVSETEYSIKVGADRYYLLDAANWTCREV